jgi:hypothetical protein
MKKILVAAVAVVLITLSSCSSGTSSLLGGSWSFKNITYNAVSAIGSTTLHTLTATTGSTSEVDDLVFHFVAYPPAPGTYTIVNTPTGLTSSQVYIVQNIGTKVYTVDVSGASTATVTVSGTKVSVNVPSVLFSNTVLQASDNGQFIASITQNL